LAEDAATAARLRNIVAGAATAADRTRDRAREDKIELGSLDLGEISKRFAKVPRTVSTTTKERIVLARIITLSNDNSKPFRGSQKRAINRQPQVSLLSMRLLRVTLKRVPPRGPTRNAFVTEHVAFSP